MASKQHPDGYWTEERILSVAKTYEYKEDFRKNEKTVYSTALRLGILSKVTQHMKKKRNILPPGYWNKERCREEALKYKHRIEFAKGSCSAYAAAQIHGWLDEICGHMTSKNNPKGFWTKQSCAIEALKYETRTAFKLGSPGAQLAAYKNGWLDEICRHMRTMIHHYSKQECAKEALKYQTKTEFMEKSPLYYSQAIRNGFINEICKHMKKLGNPEKRAVYVFEFADNHAYIGLTLNLERREKEHKTDKKSSVYKYIIKSGCQPIFKPLTGYLPKKKAAQKEDDTIIEYSKNGWFMLNKKRGGDLGSKSKKFTKKLCKRIALQYSDRTEFHKKNSYFYNYIWCRGWLDELCAHMTRQKNENGYWTKERCAEEARKYKKRIHFQKGCLAAFSAAWKKGFLDEICSHMSYNEYDPVKWSKEKCIEEGRKFGTRGEFKKNNPSAYKAAREQGWLDEIFENKPFHGYRSKQVMITIESKKKEGKK